VSDYKLMQELSCERERLEDPGGGDHMIREQEKKSGGTGN